VRGFNGPLCTQDYFYFATILCGPLIRRSGKNLLLHKLILPPIGIPLITFPGCASLITRRGLELFDDGRLRSTRVGVFWGSEDWDRTERDEQNGSADLSCD
jgi:hypothetical protein